jgi:APA family basic amino acid/polyamine antiporter
MGRLRIRATSGSLSEGRQGTLQRALGRWDLTAFGVNIVIGGAVFLTPSLVAAELGNWSPIAVVLVGLACLCIALSYAEVGSRFESTGGPYLYTLAAFGRFVAFEVGWMSWFTRVASIAALVHGLAFAIAFYAPAVSAGLPRAALIVGVLLGVALINARGIRQSAIFIDGITIAKLTPLVIFIAAGLFFVDWSRLTPLPAPSVSQWGTGTLLIIYALGGYEVIGVPAGETRHPRTDLAFAMAMTVIACTIIFTLVQIITMTMLPEATQSKTPVADAAAVFLGPAGALMIGIGSLVSITGNVTGSLLTASRYLFAFAETDTIPRTFAYVHPRFRTPTHAIWFSTAVALALALSGSFVLLVAASAIARLLTYSGVSAAALVLRRAAARDKVAPAAYVVPFGPLIPCVAIIVSLTIITGATRPQLAVSGAALGLGALLFFGHRWLRRNVR